MEQPRKRLVSSVPPGNPAVLPIEVSTLAERMEEARLQVEALEREIAGVIAERRAGAD